MSSSFADLPLVYFPFLIACVLMIVIALGGYLKDNRSLILSNILVLWGFIECLAYLAQVFVCLVYGTYLTSAISAVAYISYLAFNISGSICFDKKIAKRDD